MKLYIKCIKRGGAYCSSDSCEYQNDECEMDKKLHDINVLSHEELILCLLDGIPNSQLDTCEDHITSNSFEHYSFAVRLENTHRALTEFKFPNFVYYRSKQITFVDLDPGFHEHLMTYLYWLENIRLGKVSEKTPGVWVNRLIGCKTGSAEKFISTGMGFFSSSISGFGMSSSREIPILYSKDHKLSFQEKKIFASYKFNSID